MGNYEITIVIGMAIFLLGVIIGGLIKIYNSPGSKNNRSPVLTAKARIVKKRLALDRSQVRGLNAMPPQLVFYVTFETVNSECINEYIELEILEK